MISSVGLPTQGTLKDGFRWAIFRCKLSPTPPCYFKEEKIYILLYLVLYDGMSYSGSVLMHERMGRM
jgi:hypothetical protein